MKDLELAPIGWQLFILGSYQSDSTAFPLFLDTYATRLLARPLSRANLASRGETAGRQVWWGELVGVGRLRISLDV